MPCIFIVAHSRDRLVIAMITKTEERKPVKMQRPEGVVLFETSKSVRLLRIGFLCSHQSLHGMYNTS